jgi:hypothetical protein
LFHGVANPSIDVARISDGAEGRNVLGMQALLYNRPNSNAAELYVRMALLGLMFLE